MPKEKKKRKKKEKEDILVRPTGTKILSVDSTITDKNLHTQTPPKTKQKTRKPSPKPTHNKFSLWRVESFVKIIFSMNCHFTMQFQFLLFSMYHFRDP